MNRKPPLNVIEKLRREVGFVCPVPGCESPYLCWHHFDPPWSQKNHHNVEGMIALCIEHHNKADANAYTKEQLRNLKKRALSENKISAGTFDWMRNRLLLVIGGNFFLDCDTAVEYKNSKVVGFSRNDEGLLLLTIQMVQEPGSEKLVMKENRWVCYGNPVDIECPPSGRRLRVKYSDGDRLDIAFTEHRDLEALRKKYPTLDSSEMNLDLPITTVGLTITQERYGIRTSPTLLEMPGKNMFRGCVVQGVKVAMKF